MNHSHLVARCVAAAGLVLGFLAQAAVISDRNGVPGPLFRREPNVTATRRLALVQVAHLEAVNAVAGRCPLYAEDPAAPPASPEAAAAQAEQDILARLHPTNQAALDGFIAALEAQFTYRDENGQITITGYTGTGGTADIPDMINGLPVTTIGESAFSECTGLTSVILPSSVTTIGPSAFADCTSLNRVTIGDNVTNIETDTFAGCSSLTTIIIPANVTSIGSGAFYSCTSLASAPIPDSVISIGSYAFTDCSSLSEVIIPNSATTVGKSAFAGCTGLTRATIGDNVTSVEPGTFGGCTSLITIIIPAKVTSLNSFEGCGFDCTFFGAFAGCTSLTNITIGNSLTNIGDLTFVGCQSLMSVTLPHSITTIGRSAFADCTGLTSVTLPNGISTIAGQTFQGCSSLTNATIGINVTTIEDSVFQGCTSLISITLPKGISKLADGAFSDCTKLSSVNCQGNAPHFSLSVLFNANNATVYHLPGTMGWGTTFADRPTALWSLPYPVVLSSGPGFGVVANGFGFLISWATNAYVVVEASPALATPVWTPVSTNTLNGGTAQFTDPQWVNHPSRLYRLLSP